MSGSAAVLIWQDVAPEAAADYHRWQTTEHAPSRLACPGFSRVRRHRAADPGRGDSGVPGYFVLYEADAPEALTSPEYLELLQRPTPWSRDIVGSGVITNFVRASSVLSDTVGDGVGAHVGTLDFTAPREAVSLLRTSLEEAVAADPFLVSAHVYEADAGAIAARDATTEGTWGDGGTRVARTTVLVEGAGADAVGAAVADLRRSLEDSGTTTGLWSGLYQLTNVVETPAASPFAEVARP